MDNFFDVDFFQNKCTVLVKHLYVLYICSGAFFSANYVRFKLRCFLVVYLCFGYFYCTTPPIKGLLLDKKNEHTFDAVGFLIFIHFVYSNIYLIHSNQCEFNGLFDLIFEHSNEPVITIDTDNLNISEDYLLKETNILKICFRIYQGLISWLSMMYFSKLFNVLLSNGTPIQVNDESEFWVPFICSDCNTPLSYFLTFNSTFFFAIPFGIFLNVTLFLFMVLSIYVKNRAIRLRNDIKFYSDVACENFENYDKLEEQELKRRRPSTFQLREINQLKERQVREYMSKVHQWIQIHQRLIGFVKQYQKCAKKIVDLQTTYSFLGLTFMAYFFTRYVLDGGNFNYTAFIHLAVSFLTLLVCGKLGNDLGDVTEIISDSIYSTPWIHLPINEQKVILNFLTLSQRTQEMTIFGSFALCLELIPSKLNDAYGYVQLMRLLAMRNKN